MCLGQAHGSNTETYTSPARTREKRSLFLLSLENVSLASPVTLLPAARKKEGHLQEEREEEKEGRRREEERDKDREKKKMEVAQTVLEVPKLSCPLANPPLPFWECDPGPGHCPIWA